MIIKEKVAWLRLLFYFRGTSFEKTWPRILAVTVVSVIVTYVELYYNIQNYTLTTTPFTLIGIALGIFLGFRNSAAYDRFWEGRKLWGALVNTARTLARQAYSLIDARQDDKALMGFREKFVRRVIAFVHALRCHLRHEDPAVDIEKFLSQQDFTAVIASTHRPLAILQQLGRDLAYARNQGWLHELNAPFIDAQLAELSNILGACERINNTPIPFTYSILIHRIVAAYCFFLPFGLVEVSGILTPAVVLFISYAFLELDAIGDEIENPFGKDPNDLPLSTISRTIESNLLELIDSPECPEPLKPVNNILL